MALENTGNGAVVTLTNQTLVVGPKKITVGGKSIGTIDVTDLSATRGSAQKLIPEDIAEVDEVSIEGNWNSEAVMPKLGDVSAEVSTTPGNGDELTITWPLYPGQLTAAKLTGTGFFTGIAFPDFENNAPQEGSMTWNFNGAVGPTYTPATVEAEE